MKCMLCPTMWMQYDLTEDAVTMKLDPVSLKRLQCACSATSAGCSVAAVVAEPTAVSLNVDAVDAVYHNVEALWCVVVCSTDEGEWSDPAGMAVRL